MAQKSRYKSSSVKGGNNRSFCERLVPKYIRTLLPYEPGKPVEEVERELGISKCIKMASNENPLGPSPLAKRALKAAANKVHFYPEGDAFYLRRRMLKELKTVSSGELIFGNGSNEIIELLIRCFVARGDNIVQSQYAFVVYRLITQGAGGITLEAPAKDFGHDLNAMAALVNRRTKLVFIANPNNPTGTYTTAPELVRFLKKVRHIPVVMDEAYYEYARAKDYPQTLELRKKFPNLVILRTFSKIYGLAGARIGYGIADSSVVQYLNRLRQPFNTNLLAQHAATAALDDAAHRRKSQKLNEDGKHFLYRELKKLGIGFLPTEANFILVKSGNGRKVFGNMLRLGVVVRPMDVYGLPDYIRVTIDREANNKKFLKALLTVIAR